MVFDGARAFEGVIPNFDLHRARVNNSAAIFHLEPIVSLDTWTGLANDGVKLFGRNAEFYNRPYWAETGTQGGIRHDPASTRWCL